MLAERVGGHHVKQQPQEDVCQDSTGCCRYSPGFLALSFPATGALHPEVCVVLEPFSESQLLLGRAMTLATHRSEGGCKGLRLPPSRSAHFRPASSACPSWGRRIQHLPHPLPAVAALPLAPSFPVSIIIKPGYVDSSENIQQLRSNRKKAVKTPFQTARRKSPPHRTPN